MRVLPGVLVLTGMLVLAAMLVVPQARAQSQGCGVAAPCAVAGGSYRVSPPTGTPAGAPGRGAVFLHGYGASGDDMMGDDDLRAAFARAGVLLVLPNAPGGNWHLAGLPRNAGQDDGGFVAAVADDAARRWGIDRRAMWLGGFSVGASMVWDIACFTGGFAAYIAISGQFWDRLPDHCAGAPVNLMQIHGLTDPVFPLEGRAIGGAHQGDLFASLAIMRALDGCRSNPDEMAVDGAFVRRGWTSCRSGARLALLLHDGGHEMPDGWFWRAWPWVQAVTGR